MIEKKLEVSDYGLYLLSPSKLLNFLKEKRIRSKKLLGYFQKNHDIYLESLKRGVWLPILTINSVEYLIKIASIEEFDNDWEKVSKEEGFNLEVGQDDNLWIGSISNLHNWNEKEYNKTKKYNSYKTLDEETLYSSFGLDVDEGKYLINIIGYKRKEELNYPEANYGFLFEFNKIENFDGYKDPREDDKYFFNIAQMNN